MEAKDGMGRNKEKGVLEIEYRPYQKMSCLFFVVGSFLGLVFFTHLVRPLCRWRLGLC